MNRLRSTRKGQITVCNMLLDEYCTPSLRIMAEQESDFESTIKKCPLKLLDLFNKLVPRRFTSWTVQMPTSSHAFVQAHYNEDG